MSETGPASLAGQVFLRRLQKAGESLNAYSARRGLSAGRLSRIIRGKLECTLEIAIMIRDDYGVSVDMWTREPRETRAGGAAA